MTCWRRAIARRLRSPPGTASIAFPAISTGVYGYPLREAADVAVETVAAELALHELPRRVILCTYDTLATLITTEAFEAFKAQAAR